MRTPPGKSPDTGFRDCPRLGVGLGLRRPLLEAALAATDIIDWLEITPENWMARGGRARALLRQAAAVYPLVPHGVSLSIGSVDPLDERYLNDLDALLQDIDPPWFSDHLCFSSVGGAYFNDLIPLPRTREAVRHVADRVRRVQDRFQRLFLLENISAYFEYPDNDYDEADFLARVLETADCGLLLDVNNVYVNACNPCNLIGDPRAFLDALPLDRVVQIHMAGHHVYPEGRVDTHGSPVCEDVWALLDWVLARSRPCALLLERDTHLPPFEELRPELLRLHAAWEKTVRAEPAAEVLGVNA